MTVIHAVNLMFVCYQMNFPWTNIYRLSINICSVLSLLLFIRLYGTLNFLNSFFSLRFGLYFVIFTYFLSLFCILFYPLVITPP